MRNVSFIYPRGVAPTALPVQPEGAAWVSSARCGHVGGRVDVGEHLTVHYRTIGMSTSTALPAPTV
jgi:hypothetical protein